MAITDGAYKIITALSSSLALEVQLASVSAGGNVRIWTDNGSAAQKYYTTDYGDSGAQLSMSLSGCAVDAHDGLTVGKNISQQNDTDTSSQRWDIVADGNAMTIGSTSYPTYAIKCHANTSLCMGVAGNSATSGANVEVQTYSAGTAGQRWAFVPIDAFTEYGTYAIMSEIGADLCVDVQGEGTASGTNVFCHPYHDGANQQWVVRKNDDGTLVFIGVQSEKALNNHNAGTTNGTEVTIEATNLSVMAGSDATGGQDAASDWLVQRAGSMTINGATYPTYIFETQVGTTGTGEHLVMDAAAVTGAGDIHLWEKTGNANQRWALVPVTACVTDLPVPAVLTSGTITGNGTTMVPVTISCPWTTFQSRVRFRTQSASGAWSAWSDWMNAVTSRTGNSGWGDAWGYTMKSDTSAGDTKPVYVTVPSAYQTDGSTVIATDMQVEVRAFSSEYKDTEGYYAHGASASSEIRLNWIPTAKITAATLYGDGLYVSYSSDLKALGGTVHIIVGDGIELTETGRYLGSGSIIVPPEKLRAVPTGTETISLWLGRDVMSDKVTQDTTITTGSDQTAATLTTTETGYGTYIIGGISATDTAQCFVLSGDNVEMKRKSDGTFESIAPLTEEVTAAVWVSRADGTWDARNVTLPAIKSHAFVWIWEGGACVLDLNTSAPGATQEDSMDRDAVEYTVLGRKRHSYRLLRSGTRDLSVTGATVDDLPEHGSVEALQALLEAGHAVFRNQRGEVLNVAVTAVSAPLSHYGWTEVKVTQHEEVI